MKKNNPDSKKIISQLLNEKNELTDLGREIYLRLSRIEAKVELGRVCPICETSYAVVDENTHRCLAELCEINSEPPRVF
jgi:hypothetical protein